MPDFDVDRDRINVFPVGDAYVFTHYFDRTDLFEALREYYDGDAYRFEVPAAEFPRVEERLLEAYFEPVVVDDPETYCVVKEQYTEHADILRNAVVSWERRGHLFFLMEDELSVQNALDAGARRLDTTEFAFGL